MSILKAYEVSVRLYNTSENALKEEEIFKFLKNVSQENMTFFLKSIIGNSIKMMVFVQEDIPIIKTKQHILELFDSFKDWKCEYLSARRVTLYEAGTWLKDVKNYTLREVNEAFGDIEKTFILNEFRQFFNKYEDCHVEYIVDENDLDACNDDLLDVPIWKEKFEHLACICSADVRGVIYGCHNTNNRLPILKKAYETGMVEDGYVLTGWITLDSGIVTTHGRVIHEWFEMIDRALACAADRCVVQLAFAEQPEGIPYNKEILQKLSELINKHHNVVYQFMPEERNYEHDPMLAGKLGIRYEPADVAKIAQIVAPGIPYEELRYPECFAE